MVGLAQLAAVAGVVMATVLQFVGALCVREFARGLWRREAVDSERSTAASAGGEGMVEVERYEDLEEGDVKRSVEMA